MPALLRNAASLLGLIDAESGQIDDFELAVLKRGLAERSPLLVEFMEDPALTLRKLMSKIPFLEINGADDVSRNEVFQDVKNRLEQLRNQKKAVKTTSGQKQPRQLADTDAKPRGRGEREEGISHAPDLGQQEQKKDGAADDGAENDDVLATDETSLQKLRHDTFLPSEESAEVLSSTTANETNTITAFSISVVDGVGASSDATDFTLPESTAMLVEWIETDSELLNHIPSGALEDLGVNFDDGVRNTLKLLVSGGGRGVPVDGLHDLLKSFKQPLSKHGLRLLGALVSSSSGMLDLGSMKVGDAGCTLIADALKINSTLTTLDLRSNQVGDAGCAAIADALKINSTLTTLGLSDNKIGDAGCTAIADALKINSTLTSLDLSDNKIGDAGCTAIGDALKINSTLTSLGLLNNWIGDAGCTAIGDALKINSTLTTLDLYSNRIGDAGCTAIADALKINSTLTTLNLSFNQVGNAGCEAIGDALKINSTLTTLNLSFNRIGDAGCKAIGDALKINSTLTTLHLSGGFFKKGEIGDAGCTAIGDALKINSTLTTLDLYSNRIGDAGCTAIADALKINSTLTTLNLSFNQVGNAGCEAIGDALKINSTLTTLHLSGGFFKKGEIGDAGCTAIGDALKINSTLTTLHLSANIGVKRKNLRTEFGKRVIL